MAARMDTLHQSIHPTNDRCELLKCRSTRWVGSGLLNLGETSFINSVLQCLLHAPPTLNYAHHCPTAHDFCVFCEVKKLAVTPHPASPKAFVRHLKFIGRELHRLHECDPFLFLSLLLQRFPDQLFVSIVFSIDVREEAKCTICSRVEESRQVLSALSLDGQSLQSAIFAWQGEKSVVCVCSVCNAAEVQKSRRIVHSAPLVLVVRVRQLPDRQKPQNGGMEYDNILKLMEAGERPVEYELFAVLVHAGDSLERGHFYSFVLTGSRAWYCMDDVETVPVEASTVRAHPGAYILFYQQRRREPLDQLLDADGQTLAKGLVGEPQDDDRFDLQAAREALSATFAKVARSY